MWYSAQAAWPASPNPWREEDHTGKSPEPSQSIGGRAIVHRRRGTCQTYPVGSTPEILWYQRGWIARDHEKGWFRNLDPHLVQPSPCVEEYDGRQDTFQGLVIASGAAPDGHIHPLTGDPVGTGFFRNKTRFDEVETTVSDVWSDHEGVQRGLCDAGIMAMATAMITLVSKVILTRLKPFETLKMRGTAWMIRTVPGP